MQKSSLTIGLYIAGSIIILLSISLFMNVFATPSATQQPVNGPNQTTPSQQSSPEPDVNGY